MLFMEIMNEYMVHVVVLQASLKVKSFDSVQGLLSVQEGVRYYERIFWKKLHAPLCPHSMPVH
jgi:hypothetical protein